MAQTYWGSEVAKNFGIGSSNLGKYCLALKEAGYPFDRGNTLDKYRQVETSIQEKQAHFTFNILNSNKGA
ncbi:hypothetical protein COL30_11130 [Bacillus pseudomycoides]|uniref:Uncharacterized protein n=1 Tax=Bacillus pseudomycoides TaxID=64104 RepID=A0A2C4WWR6_9BACI|nr:hypothetical protein [Bacillus pseudomycoides]PGC46124.1 hypothetical protein COM22_31320 [Bacillus wiedmannii]PDY44930.1 hypothetical protein CON79_22980 [Bacillus pseudomycoides]PEA83774.1 hypothetical protein CON99_09760 [Bacillus pseudomycoides]PED07508.1 hypothetical protein COO19_15070 [Bacillus pseudomycoides]PED70655.1 hypothetical protein CON97_18395 [Bacillus pseudomycoides]